MSGQEFGLGDVLSVTTGSLVSRRHMDGVYAVCDFMTGASNFTHQLLRVIEECKPEILRQHPALAVVEVPDWDKPSKEEVYAWLDQMEAIHGPMLILTPLADEDHTHIDPISELGMMGVPPAVDQ